MLVSEYTLKAITFFFRSSRHLIRKRKSYNPPKETIQTTDLVNDLIRTYIDSEKPCMIARFGDVELEVVCTYLITQESSWKKKIAMFFKGGGRFFFDEQLKKSFSNNAGFFPATSRDMEKYAKQVLEEVHSLNVLHSWLPGEYNLSVYFPKEIIFTMNYHPYLSATPWMKHLENKKVLVISPFSCTIEEQYRLKREKLFENKSMLPKFDLIVLKAVQSAAGIQEGCGYKSWFDALDFMCSEINKIDFDIALIGAGSYGISLAAYIKKIGKKSIQTAGGTQLLFGIKGKRWDNDPVISSLYNEHWTRPSPSETPNSSSRIESGCYW